MSGAGVNIPLLRKAVEWAEAEAAKPEIDRQWDQTQWFLSSDDRAFNLLYTVPLTDIERDQVEAVLAAHCGTSHCIAGYVGALLDERFATTNWIVGVHVKKFARDALGLNHEQADRLFNFDNSIADVRRIAEELAGERL